MRTTSLAKRTSSGPSWEAPWTVPGQDDGAAIGKEHVSTATRSAHASPQLLFPSKPPQLLKCAKQFSKHFPVCSFTLLTTILTQMLWFPVCKSVERPGQLTQPGIAGALTHAPHCTAAEQKGKARKVKRTFEANYSTDLLFSHFFPPCGKMGKKRFASGVLQIRPWSGQRKLYAPPKTQSPHAGTLWDKPFLSGEAHKSSCTKFRASARAPGLRPTHQKSPHPTTPGLLTGTQAFLWLVYASI